MLLIYHFALGVPAGVSVGESGSSGSTGSLAALPTGESPSAYNPVSNPKILLAAF
jgi:hypothetical protein